MDASIVIVAVLSLQYVRSVGGCTFIHGKWEMVDIPPLPDHRPSLVVCCLSHSHDRLQAPARKDRDLKRANTIYAPYFYINTINGPILDNSTLAIIYRHGLNSRTKYHT